MRVAIFFDGKNFYKGMREFDPALEIDQERLAEWVTHAAGGAAAEFAGAYYYTGHSDSPEVGDLERGRALGDFLTYLSLVRGYFVRREPRVVRHTTCKVCHASYDYTTEKRVDTRMVAELIQYAAVNAYDIAVLASGDEDLVPAVEAVNRLGKRVFVGHWPGQLVARELRAACFGRIDFGLGLDSFISQRRRLAIPVSGVTGVPGHPQPSTTPTLTPSADEGPLHDAILRELRAAGTQLPYVSRWYFVNKWRGEGMPTSVAERERLIDELITRNQVAEDPVTDPKGRLSTAIRATDEGEAVAPLVTPVTLVAPTTSATEATPGTDVTSATQ